MTSFNYGAKGVREVDPACRCHQSNVMPDSFNIVQSVTCLFVLLCFMCVLRGDIMGSFLFLETGCSVLSLLHQWTWGKLKL